jgi:hypothetical protein
MKSGLNLLKGCLKEWFIALALVVLLYLLIYLACAFMPPIN